MIVYRIVKSIYQNDLMGKGAELFGGRWNPIGIPALYTSENRALTILELLANANRETVPLDLKILSIEIPNKRDKELVIIEKLPKAWDSQRIIIETQLIGKRYFENKDALGIVVPSAIVNQENNLVLNPRHKYYDEIKIVKKEKFVFDKRLFK